MHNTQVHFNLFNYLSIEKIARVMNALRTSTATAKGSHQDHPLMALPREDLDLITELVLQSGSLKGLAKSVGVSYPTIRHRLDTLIKRLQAVLGGRKPDPLRELLAQLVERGELNTNTARKIIQSAAMANTISPEQHATNNTHNSEKDT